MIYLGADHRGFYLKEKVTRWLFEWGYEFLDLGALSFLPGDDYVKYASEVASLVGKEGGSKGILFCGSGVGADISANKFDGVRASIGKNTAQIMAGRNDDDMNILVLAADYTKESDAKEMTKAFLETKFGGKERYKKRIEEIKRIEENN